MWLYSLNFGGLISGVPWALRDKGITRTDTVLPYNIVMRGSA
jgi:hypothetical protein